MESDPSLAEVAFEYGLNASTAIATLLNAYVFLVLVRLRIKKRHELKRLSTQLKSAKGLSPDVDPNIQVGVYIDPVKGKWVRGAQPSEKAIRDLLS